MTKKIILLLCVLVISYACKSDDDINQSEIDQNIISKYLKDNNLEAIKTESGLHYIIHEKGEGKAPTKNSIIKFNSRVLGTNGIVYSDYLPEGQEVNVELDYLLLGLVEGYLLLKEGGSATLIAPSHLAYKDSPPDTLTELKNQVVIFEIKLIEVID
ncbi:FKBP-type peptidyl-prolyl cis-trans isomerase [Aquimarina sp. 2201CG1-2-11]|uniref:FKBP-type peptidyl-prolyl cis-trans isomerase n=1 Tax=Aquimarina discodermiae TaxID=3231043 RepID=UPI0034630326